MPTAPTDNHPPRDAWARKPRLSELTRQDIWWLRRGFLERLWPDVRGMSVIEVGSGPAHDSLTFAERGARVTALDCSQTGLELAWRFYRGLGLPLQTMLGFADNIPFEDGRFDMAFNAGVLEHFTDEQLEVVIDEMIRVVHPGGYVLAFCPNRFNVFYQANLKRARQHAYDFERAFTAGEVRKRFEARGLLDVHVSGVHVHPAPNYFLPTWLPKYHRIEPFFRRMFAPLERLDGLHRLKSLIGQDFVVWGRVPKGARQQQAISHMRGGPAVQTQTQTRKAA